MRSVPHSRTNCPQAALHATRAVLRLLFGPPAGRSFAVRFWDGSVDGPSDPPARRFTLVLRHAVALRRMLLPVSELSVAEAYLRDEFDVEGDLIEAAAMVDLLVERLRSPVTDLRLLPRLLSLPKEKAVRERSGRGPWIAADEAPHSRRRDASAVRFHYDVGNDFYRLWLDRRMIYSCAYFETGDEDIDTAQQAKLDYICRKLRLRPGERLLDIGCGWGGLVQHAVEHYGVRALGVTLSEPQAHLARERITEAGLADRCRIAVRDYRDLTGEGTFDKVVSVGMVEHVGRAELAGYFARAFALTRPGGLFLNHGIVALAVPSRAARILWREGAFVQRYVFPDGELSRPGETIRAAERAGFETRDLESLREHYALTLRHWVRRLEAHEQDAIALAGRETYRVWRLYMSASVRAFATGRIGVVQVLFSRPGRDGACALPRTRADLYAPAGA